MASPATPAAPLRWQLLTDALETRQRWSAFCDRQARRQNAPIPLLRAVQVGVGDGRAEPAAAR